MIEVSKAIGLHFLVMEDGPPVHTAIATADLHRSLSISPFTHSPSSPNLNPIEGSWRIMKAQLQVARTHATSSDGLWADVQRAWDGSQDNVDRMIESMSDRRLAVLKTKGWHTRYFSGTFVDPLATCFQLLMQVYYVERRITTR